MALVEESKTEIINSWIVNLIPMLNSPIWQDNNSPIKQQDPYNRLKQWKPDYNPVILI